MNIKKILSSFLLVTFLFTNLGITTTLAKSEKTNSKKEFSLKDKFSGEKLKKVKNSIKQKDNYKVVIKSEKTLKELKNTYKILDPEIKIKNIGAGIFSLKISKNSLLAQDFANIDAGALPETLGEETVLEPEIFEGFDSNYLSGEEINNLGYLENIKANTFQEELNSKPKIKVGVLDTGIDETQDDLKDNYDNSLSYDFINETNNSLDDNGHGTQVAGVLGAQVNGKGIYGVNSNVGLVSLKVLDKDGFGTSYDTLEAIDYAVKNNIKVINLSFGGNADPSSSAVCKAITDAKNAGTITVVSAGNSSTDVKNIVPAGCADAITVGSDDKDGNKSAFSNFGASVDIYAPGENIYTTNLNNGYVIKNGTSFSAPIIAGLVSKELASGENLGYDEVLSNLKGNYNLNTSPLAPENPSPLAPLSNPHPQPLSFGVEGSSGSLIGSGNTASGLTLSGVVTETPVDYSKMKYYSGYFIHEGKTYGNSLYDDSFSFTSEDLKGIQIYTYDEYQNILKNSKADFSAMSYPTNGLVGSWDLNGNAYDTSGNNNNGTPYNVTWVDSGRNDGKLVASFNGVNSYIDINSTNLSFFTFNLKYKPNSNSNLVLGGKEEVVFYAYSGQQDGYGYIHNHSQNSFYKSFYIANQNGVYFPNQISSNIQQGIEYNITGKYEGTTFKIYLNGVLNNSSNFNGNIRYNDKIKLGAVWTNKQNFNGQISNLKVYNRALSDSEIQQLYLDGLGVNNQTSTNTPTYLNSPMFLNPALAYNPADNNALNYITNKALLSNSNTAKATEKAAGDPVNLATGEFDYENTLISIPGKKLPYEFKLNYKNQTYYNGPTGINWDHNYNKYLTGETNGNVLYYNGKLGVFRFINSGTGFNYNPGLKANLVLSGGLYQINYDSGDSEYFNTDKKLSKVQDIYSNNLNFSYSGGLLSQVTDTLGRNITYNYYDHNRLKEVVDFNGRKVELNYFTGATNSGSIYDLKEIKINNGTGAVKTINFEYSTGGDDTANHNITKLIDSKGQTYVTNTYLNDRVATQKYGTGTITYNYTLSGSQVTKNSVTDRVGNVIDYFYDTNGNNTQTKYYTSSGNRDYYYTYNSLGYLESEKKPNGNGTKYSYDTKGNILEKREKADILASDSTNDIVTSYTYNAKNQVLTRTDAMNHVSTNTYDINGNLTQTTTSNLQTSTGASYTTTKSFSYNTGGLLTQSVDVKGSISNYSYSGGLLTTITTGTGANQKVENISYNAYGIPTSKTDARGNTSYFEINNFNQVGTGVTSEGIVTSFEYDSNGNLTTKIVPLPNPLPGGEGTVSENYTYDILDNPTKIESNYDSGKTLQNTLKYDNNGNLTEKQVGSGALVKYSYNEFAKVKEERIIVNPSDSTKDIITSYVYDNNGNIISKTSPQPSPGGEGVVSVYYTYDLYDRLIKETKVDGSYTLVNYNKDGTINKQENYSSGNVKLSKKEFVYNGIGKVLKEISYKDPVNNTGAVIVMTDYDNNGNVINKTSPQPSPGGEGVSTIYTYDNYNNLIETIDALGNKVVNEYDKNNNLKTSSQPSPLGGEGVIMNYSYDNDNRLISETNNLNKTKTYTYNNLNQITSITDEKGNITNYTYDYNGKVKTKVQHVNSQNITTSYTYDERGNNTSITDQNGNVTTYTYNNLNQLTKTKYADNKEVNYSYDKVGNLISQTDPNGSITSNTYNNLNQLTNRNIQTGTGVLGVTSESYSYDELGRLVETNDSNNHKLNFSYDSLNRLISETSPQPSPQGEGVGTGIVTVSYEYDDNNNLLTVTNPNGKVTNYTYDELNRVLGISFSGNTIANYSYTGILNDEINLGNNLKVNQSFDSLNRLSSITVTNPSLTLPLSLMEGKLNYSYTYDDVSNITSDSFKNYTYDDIYRLTQVNESLSGTSLESFSYDSAGNRTSSEPSPLGGEGVVNYTSNNLNQYTSLSGTTLSGSLVYDNNGNLKQNSKFSFAYDYKNRLVKVTNLSGTGIIAEFKYDVLGRRYEKKTSTETVSYIYSDKNIILEYKSSNGKVFKKDYVNGLGVDDVIAVEQEEANLSFTEREELSFCNDRVLGFTGSFIQYGWQNIVDRCNNLQGSGSEIVSNTYYLHKNHLGSIVGITDNSGSLVSSYEYDSYGNFSLSGADIGNTILFTGREFDKEIGLYYYRARYYDADLGRFISRDPIGQDGGINIYEYVNDNPVNFTDFDGLNPKPAITDIVGDVVDLITDIDWNNAQYKGGEFLRNFGYATSAVSAPACASSISITTTCVGVTGGMTLATGGVGAPSMSICIPSGVTAGASCGVTAVGAGIAAGGSYMMNSSGKGKETGSYTIKFKSGKEYHGKGPESRSKESAKRESKNNNDEIESINWEKAKDDRDAFIQEALKIKKSGGLGPNNYNRINSPGNKYLP